MPPLENEPFEEETEETAFQMNRRALRLDEESKYDEAEALYVRALAIREREWGGAHPSTKNTAHGMMNVWTKLGKTNESAALIERFKTQYDTDVFR
jgi:hypothetical protein